MKLLILGASASNLALLRIFAEGDHFHTTGWLGSDEIHTELKQLFPAGRNISEVTEFNRNAVNAVVFVGNGGDTEQRESILRDLARDGIPLLLAQPACSAIMAVELDMIQRDTGAPMIPLHADSLQPGIELLVEQTASPEGATQLGNIEQIVMERTAHTRDDETVRAELAKDALLLRRLVGSFQKVGAMQSGESKSLSNMSVHLTGSTRGIARWSIGPANVTESEGATLEIIGEKARLKMTMPKDEAWSMESATSDSINPDSLQTDMSTALIAHIEKGLDGKAIQPSWEDAFRCIDLADTASESVRRGKTLPLSNTRVTEEDTFKSMMAAGGCLIILILPLLLLLVSLVDGLKLPYNKTTTVDVGAGERRVDLPADLSALNRISLGDTDLQLMTANELFDSYGLRQRGTPRAYSLSVTEITLAPIPDEPVSLNLIYEGSFHIWKGWPFLLLAPIALFLLLQLLKLVFPKPVPAP